MKLFFDQNLSHRLVTKLSDAYPGSLHARDAGLSQAQDDAVWDYARRNGLAIVSKDSDFRQLSFLFGAPPKVIWISKTNCSTAEVESILRRHGSDLDAFAAEPDSSFLELG